MAAVSRALLLPTLLALILFTDSVVSDHSPAHPPSLPPKPPADEIPPSLPPHPSADEIPPPVPNPAPAPSPGGSFSSPPAPPPRDLAPNPPSTGDAPSPPPAPAQVADVSHENQPNAGDLKSEGSSSSGGMSSGQKAGVAIGVIAGACVVGIGAFVYKKRRQNIQRAQYGYAARRELL